VDPDSYGKEARPELMAIAHDSEGDKFVYADRNFFAPDERLIRFQAKSRS
jgi:hypothetical protein